MKGYRTYLIAASAALVTAAHSLGYIDQKVWLEALGFLIPGGLATLRAAVPVK